MKNQEQIKILLLKFISKNIKEDEYSELRRMLRKTSDEHLDGLMARMWADYEVSESYKNEVDDIYREIRERIRPKKANQIGLSWVGKVAVILLPVLILLSTYLFYRLNFLMGEEQVFIVQSGSGQPINMKLPDSTKVILNSGSTIIYNNKFSSTKRNVRLEGEAFFEVTRDPDQPFIVGTPYFDIEVLGTSFNVMAYETEDILETFLSSGKIRMIMKNDKEIFVEPNQKVLYNKMTGEFRVTSASDYLETSWTRGVLIFQSQTLNSIVRELERKFDVSIHLNNQISGMDKFTGVFDNKTIEEILGILQLHYGFTYKIDGRNIDILHKRI